MGQCDTDLERQEDSPNRNDQQHWRNVVQHTAMDDKHLKGKET